VSRTLFGGAQQKVESWWSQVTLGKSLVQCKVEVPHNEGGQIQWQAPEEAVQPPFLEIIRNWLNKALSNLV